ncbi:hypothetical protein D3C85_850810 [compost metagenome]
MVSPLLPRDGHQDPLGGSAIDPVLATVHLADGLVQHLHRFPLADGATGPGQYRSLLQFSALRCGDHQHAHVGIAQQGRYLVDAIATIQIKQDDTCLAWHHPLHGLDGIGHAGDDVHLVGLCINGPAQTPCDYRQVADHDDIDSGIHTPLPNAYDNVTGFLPDNGSLSN